MPRPIANALCHATTDYGRPAAHAPKKKEEANAERLAAIERKEAGEARRAEQLERAKHDAAARAEKVAAAAREADTGVVASEAADAAAAYRERGHEVEAERQHSFSLLDG